MLVKTFTFNDFQENTYVVSSNKKCIVIDPGNYYEHETHELKEYIDGIGFLFEDSKVCFSGDVIFKNSIGRTDLPGGNHETLIKSIKGELFNIGKDIIIYPGHGPKTNMADEIKSNPFLV